MEDTAIVTDAPDHEGVTAPVRRPFTDPFVTADGSQRAAVALTRPTTLWFNTGTRCNITCVNCFMESSPTNDRLTYLTAVEVGSYLQQLRERAWPVREIGFTGGEPFMNPHILDMLKRSLADGFRVLVLSNAMRPMMRPQVQNGLSALHVEWPGRIRIRVSLDHYTEERHDEERGTGAFAATLRGMDWIRDCGIPMAVAGRTMWGEDEGECRAGFARLFAERAYPIDAWDPEAAVLFPEIDPAAETPEITSECWGILGVSPDDMMCASSRMVVKRKGSHRPAVVACTLLSEDPQFELGADLRDAEGPVRLNHPKCAQFCVLGGASCSRGQVRSESPRTCRTAPASN